MQGRRWHKLFTIICGIILISMVSGLSGWMHLATDKSMPIGSSELRDNHDEATTRTVGVDDRPSTATPDPQANQNGNGDTRVPDLNRNRQGTHEDTLFANGSPGPGSQKGLLSLANQQLWHISPVDPSTGTFHVEASGLEEDVGTTDPVGGDSTHLSVGVTAAEPNMTAQTQQQSASPLSSRSILIGADHGTGDIHHDNLYVQIDNGPLMYYASIPARLVGNGLPDQGLQWHQFSRDQTAYTLYAASSMVNGHESGLSEPLSTSFDHVDYSPDGCTEQTVPVADPGNDVIVQVGNPVTLDASSSFDPHGPDTPGLIYRWNLYAAPEDPEYTMNTVATTFTPTQIGRYYFQLHVWDQVMTGGPEDASPFNPSPIAYVRVSAVENANDPYLVEANAGPPRHAKIGEQVILDGSESIGPVGTTYTWQHMNPLDNKKLSALASVFGTTDGISGYHQVNYDTDIDVDGEDLAKLANNWGAVALTQGDQAVAMFSANIPGPHIFRLTVSDGVSTSTETTLVSVHHSAVNELWTPPEASATCLVP